MSKNSFCCWGLESKLQHYRPCKISWNKSKTSHSDCSNHTEGDIMHNHEQKTKVQKARFHGQNKLLSQHPTLKLLGNFSHMATCISFLENTWKMSLITCFEQKFIMGSYGVGIGRAWYSRKACKICSSLV